jgi:hypothetical protein
MIRALGLALALAGSALIGLRALPRPCFGPDLTLVRPCLALLWACFGPV